jgi:hypothetical protein
LKTLEDQQSLELLLDRLEGAGSHKERVTLGYLLTLIGRRSFGPVLLIAGLVTLAPVLGDIPGAPTTIGVLVFLVAAQLLLRRDYVWLPEWMLQRSIAVAKLRTAIKWLRRPARFLDRLARPRLRRIAEGRFVQVIAALCMVVSAAMPVMEIVPFSANAAGGALAGFGLSLVAHDGLLALIACAITVAAIAVVIAALT